MCLFDSIFIVLFISLVWSKSAVVTWPVSLGLFENVQDNLFCFKSNKLPLTHASVSSAGAMS